MSSFSFKEADSGKRDIELHNNNSDTDNLYAARFPKYTSNGIKYNSGELTTEGNETIQNKFLPLSENTPTDTTSEIDSTHPKGLLGFDFNNKTIQWERAHNENQEGRFKTTRRNLPIGDFFTDIVSKLDNYNRDGVIKPPTIAQYRELFNSPTITTTDTSPNYLQKYEWVNLSALVTNIGIEQLTWDYNEPYTHNIITSNAELQIQYLDYLDTSEAVSSTNYNNWLSVSNNNYNNNILVDYLYKNSEGESLIREKKFWNGTITPGISPSNSGTIFKINGLKFVNSRSSGEGETSIYSTINHHDIKIGYEGNYSTNGATSGGITSLNLYSGSHGFNFNCSNINNQYNNGYSNNLFFENNQAPSSFYIKNLHDMLDEDMENITIDLNSNSRDNVTIDLNSNDGTNFTPNNIYSELDSTNSIQNIDSTPSSTNTFSYILQQQSPDLYLNTGEYDLEGGNGRRASLQITRNNTNLYSNNLGNYSIKIKNTGYLYKENDVLRFKDPRLKNLFFFVVNSVETVDEDTGNTGENSKEFFTYDFMRRETGQSSTIKYATSSNHILILKDLTISGTVESKVLVKLNNLYNILDSTDKTFQRVLKQFYYTKRDNIHEKHDLNILVPPESEMFLSLHKIIDNKDADDTDQINTLNFNLNAILYDITPPS